MTSPISAADAPEHLRLDQPFRGRSLSIGEYYHACVSSYAKSTDLPRENTLVLEGEGSITVERLQAAVDQACQANPGSHLRLVGNSLGARWRLDGEMAQVREVVTEWDGRSSKGSSFIYQTPLLLRKGVSCEFILARSPSTQTARIIFRNLHAIMDGMGCLHFLREVFRALNGQPVLGSNAHFREIDLIKQVNGSPNEYADFKQKPAYATGGVQGDEVGDAWVRITLEGPVPWGLARVAGIVAEHATSQSDRNARIAVPVNLRRHMPELQSSMNFSNVVHVDLKRGEGMAHFQKRLHKALSKNVDARYKSIVDWARLIPMATMDKWVCRNPKTYLTDRIFETAMISDLGVLNAAEFACDDFKASDLYGVPIAGNTFCLISALDNQLNITLGMPKIYASNGRLQQLADLIRDRLSPES